MITAQLPSRRVTVATESSLTFHHLAKIGQFGLIGRFSSVGSRRYRRDQQVICRTERGLEIGRVLCCMEADPSGRDVDGQLLRSVTPEDQRIIERINRFRDKAFLACSRLLQQRGHDAVLIDVEHLFDGQSLFFYFLGEVSSEVHDLTDELAAEYEKKVRFKKFTETLVNGCGPDCGKDAAGCSTGGCATCSVNGTCKTMRTT